MFPSLGFPELLIIMLVALIIFGPRKLPELGRSLGKSLGEFRKASNELKSTLEEEIRLEEVKEQRVKLDAEQDLGRGSRQSHRHQQRNLSTDGRLAGRADHQPH